MCFQLTKNDSIHVLILPQNKILLLIYHSNHNSKLTVVYGYNLHDMCGVLGIVVGMFGRWRANPSVGFQRVIITCMGVGYDLCSHLGLWSVAFADARVDLYLAAMALSEQ